MPLDSPMLLTMVFGAIEALFTSPTAYGGGSSTGAERTQKDIIIGRFLFEVNYISNTRVTLFRGMGMSDGVMSLIGRGLHLNEYPNLKMSGTSSSISHSGCLGAIHELFDSLVNGELIVYTEIKGMRICQERRQFAVF